MTKETEEIFGTDPLALFHRWFSEAQKHEPNDPDAMALACTDAQGRPSVRVVLMRGADEKGFSFFTNYESEKGRALTAHPYACANFHWKSLQRQIRIAGPVEKASAAESDAYFAARHRGSQIGSWASAQSRPVESYAQFMAEYEAQEKRFSGQDAIPRPPHWGGFRIVPERMEFWIAHPRRLHQRYLFEKSGTEWRGRWLYP